MSKLPERVWMAMAHFLVEFAGAQAAFPGGEPENPVAIYFNGKLHTGNGVELPGSAGSSLHEFLGMLGIRAEDRRPIRSQKKFLSQWLKKHYPDAEQPEPPAKGHPNKGKNRPQKKPKPQPEPKRELTEEEKLERKVLDVLKGKFPTRTLGGGRDRRGRDKRASKPRTLIFQMEDKHGKMAEATYKGNGQFEPFQPREGGGTKTLARNRWAARQFHEEYGKALGEIDDA